MRSLLLLPSSETKAPGGKGAWQPGGAGTALGATRTTVARALADAMADEVTARRITGVGAAAHRRAVEANRSALGGPVLPTWMRYRGVVWDHLDPPTLTVGARRRASTSVAAVSALAGVTRWAEALPDYKVKMSARISPLGVLGRWWRPALTAAVGELASGYHVVVDLLPGDHARAIDFDALDVGVIHVIFTSAGGRAAGHGAKAAKGRFVRHLLEGRPTDPTAAARDFAWEGWRVVPSSSDDTIEVAAPSPP